MGHPKFFNFINFQKKRQGVNFSNTWPMDSEFMLCVDGLVWKQTNFQ